MTETRIRLRILLPMAVAYLLVVALALVAFARHDRYQMRTDMDATLAVAQRVLAGELEYDAELMRGLLDPVHSNPCMGKAFQARLLGNPTARRLGFGSGGT